MSDLIYPEELQNNSFALGRPMMRMTCVKPNDNTSTPARIYVPIPTSISFSDGAVYNDAELGVIGGAAMAAARGASNGGVDGAVKAAIGTGGALVAGSNVKSMVASALGAADKLGFGGISDEVKSGVSIGMGTTLNKNITTEFTGVGTRSFTFSFKFVSKSPSETRTIANIIKTFRANLYPKGTLIALTYPSTWNIQFLSGIDGSDIEYLPKIFECYLERLESNFNPSVSVWHADGSPIETDVTVSFKESRALTYEDIKILEERPFQEGDFLSRYNIPEEEKNRLEDEISTAVGTAIFGVPVAPTNRPTRQGRGNNATQGLQGVRPSAYGGLGGQIP
jgi:hypothetical protein